MKPAFFHLQPEKREAIVAAALAEFGAQDFDAARLDRIVVAAGISKGGLYEYISAKDELYLYCMELAWSSLYRYIQSELARANTPLPADIVERFMHVAQIAIEWYLANPALLELIVRIARLPRDGAKGLAAQAEAVFERHFAEVFAGLDASRLAHPLAQVVELIKWLLVKTRKDALLEIAAGRSPDEVRVAYLAQWRFFCSILSQGIYRAG